MYINNTCVAIRFYMDLHAFKFAVYRNNRGMRPTTLVLLDTLHLANPKLQKVNKCNSNTVHGFNMIN